MILISAEPFRLSGKREQTASHRIVALGFRIGTRHNIRGFIAQIIGRIEDGLASKFVRGFFVVGFEHVGTLSQCCGRRGRTAGHCAEERKR